LVLLREIQDYPLKPVEINVAKQLETKFFRGYLKKIEGDFIYADEILATRPSFKSGGFKSLRSPNTGTIQKIDTKKGTVTICYDKKKYQLSSNCFGKVERIIDDKDVIININAVLIEGKIGFGKDTGGVLKVGLQNAESKSVVYENHVNYDDLMLLAENSISGLVCNSISYSCLKKLLNKDIGVVMTGNEDLPFTIVILSGFKKEAMQVIDTDISVFEGKHVMMKPQTQIRAGAIRPSLYVMEKNDY